MIPPETVPQLESPKHSQLDGGLNEKPRPARNGGDHEGGVRRGSIANRGRLHWPLAFFGIRWGEGMWNDVRTRAPYYR